MSHTHAIDLNNIITNFYSNDVHLQDRKVIIKSFKTHVVKICTDEHSHMVILAMIDVVDDTKIVQKAILEVWIHMQYMSFILYKKLSLRFG